MGTVIRIIDFISEYTGRVIRWACLILVLVLVYEVTARYAFNAPTIWAHETASMLGATIAALSWAYIHRHNGHVRVDIFYTRLSPKSKAIIDIICALLFFFPLLVILAYTAFDRMCFSWSFGERLISTYWYPPAVPIRLVVFLGLSLFALQGLAKFIRDLQLLIGSKSYD